MASEDTAGHRPLAVAPTLTHVARLQRDRRYRDAHGLFFVEGVRGFVAAADHGCPFDAVLYSERLLTSPLARKLVRRLKRAGVPFARVSPEQFRTISQAERASGVGAILRQRVLDLQQVTPGDRPCWVALDRVRAPGNFGTLIRTSAAIDAAGFILLGSSVDPFDPAVVRASMGALFQQTIVRAGAAQLRQWVQEHSLMVVGASPDGSAEYDQVRYTHPAVLVLGEERAGLTEEQRALCQQIRAHPDGRRRRLAQPGRGGQPADVRSGARGAAPCLGGFQHQNALSKLPGAAGSSHQCSPTSAPTAPIACHRQSAAASSPPQRLSRLSRSAREDAR